MVWNGYQAWVNHWGRRQPDMGEKGDNHESRSGHVELELAVEYSSGDPAGSQNPSKNFTGEMRTEVAECGVSSILTCT